MPFIGEPGVYEWHLSFVLWSCRQERDEISPSGQSALHPPKLEAENNIVPKPPSTAGACRRGRPGDTPPPPCRAMNGPVRVRQPRGGSSYSRRPNRES